MHPQPLLRPASGLLFPCPRVPAGQGAAGTAQCVSIRPVQSKVGRWLQRPAGCKLAAAAPRAGSGRSLGAGSVRDCSCKSG